MKMLPIAAALALSATAMAFDTATEVEEVLKFKFMTEAGSTETLVLENFAEGSSQWLQTEAGTSALVSRDADKITVEIDGEVLEFPANRHEDMHWVEHGEAHGDHEVKVIVKSADGVMALDEFDALDGDLVDVDVDLTTEDGTEVVVMRKRVVKHVEKQDQEY